MAKDKVAPKADNAWRCTSDVSTPSELNRYVGMTEIALLSEEKWKDLRPGANAWEDALNRSRQRRHDPRRDGDIPP
jgi:hypothetical protein